MIDKYRNKVEESGVSPVIGVILLVAVTVALVALSTVIVFDIGSDVSDTADITLDVSEKSDGVDVTVVRNENVEQLRVILPDGSTESFDASVGSTAQIQGEAGSYNIVAVLADGSEESINSFRISEESAVESETGVISYNPPAEGILVESYDVDGNLVDSDLTGSDGVYAVEKGEELRVMGSTVSENAMDGDGNIDLNIVADEDEGTTLQGILMEGEGTELSPYEINSASDLQVMNEDLDAHYELNSDIDASGTSEWNDGAGFNPIGDTDVIFTGNLDGQGYEISNLYIDRPDESNVGLIGWMDENTMVNNIGLSNVDITGYDYVGSIIGRNEGTVDNSYAVGDVVGTDDDRTYAGGLVGSSQSTGVISNSYANVDVVASGRVGGLVGDNFMSEVTNSYAVGDVTGDDGVHGLVGQKNGDISNSYWDINSEITEDDVDVSEDDADGTVGLTTEDMQGDDYDTGFENDIVNSDAFIGVTDEYPELQWQE